MKKILLLATGNAHKVEEMRAILKQRGLTGWEIRDLSAYPDYQAPPEDGDSFRANATIKASAAAQMSGLITLADDSGLAVDYLNGEPGVYSARYAGTGRDEDNRKKLLEALSGVAEEQRGAAFICQVCLGFPGSDGATALWFGEGRLPGRIHSREQGENGFGYDSLLYLPERGCTVAELDPETKNQLSHRFQAVAKAADLLKRFEVELE